MSDDQAREMRPETTSEHIARDMREGRFPEQSERQMVPVLASLPHEIQVWRSMDALDHTGTWSTTRYPAEAVTYVSKADAAAAQALMVERCAEEADRRYAAGDMGNPGHHIRALTPDAGTAELVRLRERAEKAEQERDRIDQWRETAIVERDTYSEERDAAEAELAAAQQREAGLREALKPFCFFGEEGGDVQHAWEIRYRDRFQDWIDFADIETARAALAEHGGTQK